MTQDELAEKLFVTRQTVSNYETGRSRPDVEMLTKIAEILGVDANTVIYGKQEPPQLRQEKLRLAVAAGITLVLAVLWFWLEPVFRSHKSTTYDAVPLQLLAIVELPAFLMMLGWTVMQGCHVFLGAKRPKEERVKWLRRGLLIALAAWLLLTLPPLADMIRLDVTRWQWMKTHTSYSSADFVLAEPWQSIVWNPVSYWLLWGTLNYWAVFPFLGAGLWLGGVPMRKGK